jgi:hypothetical protein
MVVELCINGTVSDPDLEASIGVSKAYFICHCKKYSCRYSNQNRGYKVVKISRNGYVFS